MLKWLELKFIFLIYRIIIIYFGTKIKLSIACLLFSCEDFIGLRFFSAKAGPEVVLSSFVWRLHG